MKDLERMELLYAALDTPLGIKVPCSDPVKLKQSLYPLRKQDEALQCLSFVTSPTAPEAELWIVRKPDRTDDE